MSQDLERSMKYRVYENPSELPSEEARLMEEAGDALRSSYSPYSRFAVGAALLLEGGSIVKGSNQENAAYPSGICAERVAVWKAATQAPDEKGVLLALLTEGRTDAPVSPCGSCRQVLCEFEERGGADLRVIFPGENGRVIAVDRVRDLLPFPFGTGSLRKA
jgi:cytidine deaminase